MRRHRFDPVAFLFGAIFLTVGLSVATGASGVDVVRQFRSWPTAVIVTGFVLVAWTLARVLRPAVDVASEVTAQPVDERTPDTDGQAEPAPMETDALDTDTAELDEGEPPV
jgi:hypothetical protein